MDEAIKLGKEALDTILGFADGKLDAGDVLKLGALINDLERSGLVDKLAALFHEKIGTVDGLRVKVVD